MRGISQFAGLVGLICLSLVSFPSKADAIQLDNSFSFLKLTSRGSLGDIVVAAKAIEVNGQVAVCGISWIEPYNNGKYSSTSFSALPEITRQLRYSIAGKALRFSTTSFGRVKGADAAVATDVPCVATGVAWSSRMDNQKVELDAGKVTIRR